MKTFKQFYEDVPTNTVGSGNIAGVGVGSQGEPPGIVKSKKKTVVSPILSIKPLTRNV